MTEDVILEGNAGYIADHGVAIWFSKSSKDAGVYGGSAKGTAAPVKEVQTALKVAYWGEDNRFPQNVEQQMAFCGVGKAALDWKARALWGGGIIPVKIKDYEDEGRKEVVEMVPQTNQIVWNTLRDRRFFRFWLEYLQDWSWFTNCFPEMVLSNDGKTITHMVHQESCDSRFKQMNENGVIDTVYLSKLWGMPKDQFVKFDPEKAVKGLLNANNAITEVDNKYMKALPCIDMYDPVNSAQKVAESIKSKNFKSFIYPTNYPSVNKTYYQLAAWDGARLSGWVEIASKTPSILKHILGKINSIRYHIEIPETFMQKRYGSAKWKNMKDNEQREARKTLLKEFKEFLSGEKGAGSTLMTFFEVDPHDKTEYGKVVITSVKDELNFDKELLTQSAADIQVLVAMQAHPTLFGAGTIGTGQQRSGGSDMREAKLIYDSQLTLERNVLLEPLYLMKEYNRIVGGVAEWEEDIVFRFRDTVLVTLDQNKGTTKNLS